MLGLRTSIAALEQAIERDDRTSIKAILKEAGPEFTSKIAGAKLS
jgi:hypothetical protein